MRSFIVGLFCSAIIIGQPTVVCAEDASRLKQEIYELTGQIQRETTGNVPESTLASVRDRLREIVNGIANGSTCAEASLQRRGYVEDNCRKIQSPAGHRCAVASLKRRGYVEDNCTRIGYYGGACAEASLARRGYVEDNCTGIRSDAGDRCAVASLERRGYVEDNCKH